MSLRRRTAWWLWLGAMLAGTTGCELLAQVDRSKIPDGITSGGQGGQGGSAPCGNGVLDDVEACDDGNATAGDGCSDACAVEPGYACAGEPSVCTDGCGDGQLGGSEACDDGNSAAGDCCTAACQIEPTCEIEPNDDAGQANDLVDILAGGSYLRGHVDPESDVDYFRFEVPAGATGSFAAETLTGLGGLACGANDLDPAFHVLDATGASLAENDDIAPDIGNYCARVLVEGLGPGDYYFTINRSPFAGPAAFGYLNDVNVLLAQCGNGVTEGAELCDDGNTAGGDGCSAQCAFESATPEIEPNDTPADAGANPHIDGNALISGAITPIGDEDWFAVDLTGIGDLKIETFEAGSLTDCDGVDTTLALFAPDGTTVLASDDDSGPVACAALDPAADPDLTRLDPGTYYIRVREFGGDADVAGYNLLVRITALCGDGVRQIAEECDGGPGCAEDCTRIPVCGDGLVGAGEMCDDSNTADGDGCSATCQIEGVIAETEPNDTTAEAAANGATSPDAIFAGAVSPDGDVDYYAIDVPGVADLVIETFDASGSGSCAGIDTVVGLVAPDGSTLLAEDDEGGIASCSRLDGPAVSQLAPGTYYVSVTDYHGGTIPGYTLQVSFAALCGNGAAEGAEECDGGAGCDASCQRVPSCGDGLVDAPETCDDGNTAAGDGCGATCQIEATGEVEPNGTAAEALVQGPFPIGELIAGSITPETDADVFAIDVASVSDVRVETFGGSGPGACAGADTFVELLGPDGATVLAEDDDDGADTCSLIDPPGDAGAKHLPAGTYYVRVQSFNHESLIAGYTLRVSLDAACGNGVAEGAEECDGGAGCTATCDRVPACGDGFVDHPEGCDDGNTADGDGCSAACQLEAVVPEVEPNGALAEADASAVQLGGDARITGAIGAVGDQDHFRLTLAAATVLRLEVLDGTAGDCQGGITTTLRVLNSFGAVYAADDAAGDVLASGVAGCSALVVRLPAGTYYVQVEEQGDDATVPFYLLDVKAQGSAGSESEDNNAIGVADVVNGSDVHVAGVHPDLQDSDFFRINVPAGRSIRAEIVEGGGETCESGEVDSRLTLFDGNGVQLADDDDGGRGLCSTLDGTGSTPRDAGAHALTAGNYYLRVRSSAFASGTPESFSYRLAITVR